MYLPHIPKFLRKFPKKKKDFEVFNNSQVISCSWVFSFKKKKKVSCRRASTALLGVYEPNNILGMPSVSFCTVVPNMILHWLPSRMKGNFCLNLLVTA